MIAMLSAGGQRGSSGQGLEVGELIRVHMTGNRLGMERNEQNKRFFYSSIVLNFIGGRITEASPAASRRR